MPKRCCDTHFYVGGHKTRSGNARYVTPDGTELAVVCGRNRPGPGQIHLRDVPDGTTLTVTGHGGAMELALDQSETRGRPGRVRPYELNPDLRPQILWNNLVELPDHHADYQWASDTVGGWVGLSNDRFGLGAAAPGTSHLLEALRSTNAHLYARRGTWGEVAYSSRRTRGLDPVLEYATRLCGQVCGMDRTANRRAFTMAVRELIGVVQSIDGDLPVEYFERLIGVLTTEAPNLSLSTLQGFARAVDPGYTLDLVARMAATHGVPDAATTRALGRNMMTYLLDKKEMSQTEREWVSLGILANEHLVPWHEKAAIEMLPNTLIPAAHALACPAAAELLEKYRAGALRDDTESGLRAKALQDRKAEAAGAESSYMPTQLAQDLERIPSMAASSIPSTDRLAMVHDAPHGCEHLLRTWENILSFTPGLHKGIPSTDTIYEYLDEDVRSFAQLSRLSRYGIEAHELELLEREGIRTTSQKMACGTHGVRASDLRTFRERGITELTDAFDMVHHHVPASWLLGFEQLDVTDHSVMKQLGDLHISPAGLAAFRTAGRTLDEACESAARGVPGLLCLSLTDAGIDDPDVQARLCRTSARDVDMMCRFGARGDALVTAIDTRVPYEDVKLIANRSQHEFPEILAVVISGVPTGKIRECVEAQFDSPADWVALSRHEIDPAKARFLADAGIKSFSEMLPFANAPIDSVESARACIAALSRNPGSPMSTAAAMVG